MILQLLFALALSIEVPSINLDLPSQVRGLIQVWTFMPGSDEAFHCEDCLAEMNNGNRDKCFTDYNAHDILQTGSYSEKPYNGLADTFVLPDGFDDDTLEGDSYYCVYGDMLNMDNNGIVFKYYRQIDSYNSNCDFDRPLMHNNQHVTHTLSQTACISQRIMLEFYPIPNPPCSVIYKQQRDDCEGAVNEVQTLPVGQCVSTAHNMGDANDEWEYSSEKLDGQSVEKGLFVYTYDGVDCQTLDSSAGCATPDGTCQSKYTYRSYRWEKEGFTITDESSCLSSATLTGEPSLNGGDICNGADCILGAAPKASDCTWLCGELEQEVTKEETGAGTCNPEKYQCQEGDGGCPRQCTCDDETCTTIDTIDCSALRGYAGGCASNCRQCFWDPINAMTGCNIRAGGASGMTTMLATLVLLASLF